MSAFDAKVAAGVAEEIARTAGALPHSDPRSPSFSLTAFLDASFTCPTPPAADDGDEAGADYDREISRVLSNVEAARAEHDTQLAVTTERVRELTAELPELVLALARSVVNDHAAVIASTQEEIDQAVSEAHASLEAATVPIQRLVRLSTDLERLTRLRRYLELLGQVCSLSEDARAKVESETPEDAFDPFMKLCATRDACAAYPNTEGEALARARADYIAERLRKNLSSRFNTCLKKMSWPAVKQTASHLDERPVRAFAGASVAEYSFHNAWRAGLFEQEIVDEFRKVLTNLVRVELSSHGTRKRSRALWAVQLMALPLAKRFLHHFMSKTATNRVDKPEWFFSFVLDAITEHSAFFCGPVQHALAGISVPVDALSEFIHCLVSTVVVKLRKLFADVAGDVDLLVHTLDEMLQFEQALESEYGYGSSPRSGNDLVYQRCVHLFTTDPDQLALWIKTDKHFSERKFEAAFQGAAAWDSPYKEVQPLLDQGRGGEVDELDTDVSPVHLRPPNCAEALVALLTAVTDRYRALNDPELQLLFVQQIQQPLVHKFRQRAANQARVCDVFSAAATGPDWRRYMSVVNAAHYVAMVLSDWAEEPFFLELQAAAQSLSKRAKRRGLAASASSAVVRATAGALEATRALAHAVVDSEETRELAGAMAPGGVLGPATALRALSSAITSSHLTKSALSRAGKVGSSLRHVFRRDDTGTAPAGTGSGAGAGAGAGAGVGAGAGTDSGAATPRDAASVSAEMDRRADAGVAEAKAGSSAADPGDPEWLLAEGGMLAAEVEALNELWQSLIKGAADAAAQSFRHAAMSYFDNAFMWTGSIAEALRLANDLTPAICEALATLRVTLVRACARLLNQLTVVSRPFYQLETHRYLPPRLFDAFWHRLAAEVQLTFVSGLGRLVHVSDAGEAQLRFDARALVQLFRAYSPDAEVHFEELLTWVPDRDDSD